MQRSSRRNPLRPPIRPASKPHKRARDSYGSAAAVAAAMVRGEAALSRGHKAVATATALLDRYATLQSRSLEGTNTSPLTLLAILTGFAVVVFFVLRHNGRRMGATLKPLAESLGWSDVKPNFLGETSGRWEGRETSLAYAGGGRRSRSHPCVAMLMSARGPRLVVTQREPDRDVWNKPIVVDGPPLVDLSHLPASRQLWVRCDDDQLAARLLHDPALVEAMSRVLATGGIVAADGQYLHVSRFIQPGEGGDVQFSAIVREVWQTLAMMARHFPAH